MLPYTPLHHILMRELGFPVVATSGNLSDEPICTDERGAVERLDGIADLFLVHNRPIVRHVDDSVARVMMGRELVLRRARGYAPLPLYLKEEAPPLLAVGGHLKNTIAITAGHNVFISQHIGDLETAEAFEAFQKVIRSFQTLYGIRPARVVCDMHPDYLSTQYARENGANPVTVQHHHAHVASCMAENELEGQVLGVAWDGAGYGSDGAIWGGEFLLTDGPTFKRVASFRRFPLPGGGSAIKEPRRTALGVLYEIFGAGSFELENLDPLKSFTAPEKSLLRQMMNRGVGSPLTSSVGRLFDAVASIVGLRQRVHFEGQAAMELEFAIGDEKIEEAYPFRISHSEATIDSSSQSKIQNPKSKIVVDWEPMVLAVLDDMRRTVPVSIVSAKFHNTLAKIIVDIARRVGEERVVLTGGCFQNRYLTERAIKRLQADGVRSYWHQRVPPNDGGIALGQLFVVAQAIRRNALVTDSAEPVREAAREAEAGGLSCV
jgi:hydrogenase maturation protein HypF